MKQKNKQKFNKLIKYREIAIKFIIFKVSLKVGNKDIYNQKLE